MRKILLLLLLLYGQLFALDRESTLKMYHNLFFALSSKAVTSVYVNDDEYRQVFSTSKRIKLLKEPADADIVLITNEMTLRRILRQRRDVQTENKPILFATDYRFLEKSTDIVGAFYWRKGRSQLLFIENRLDKYGIVLPSEYKNFSVDAL